MTLKSTTSSLNLANVPASLGLANSAIIPTDRDQVMREPGLPWKRRAVTSEVPTGGSWQGWVTPGSGMCLRGTRATEAPGSRGTDQHPCPLTDVERFSLPEKDYLGPPTTGLSKVENTKAGLCTWILVIRSYTFEIFLTVAFFSIYFLLYSPWLDTINGSWNYCLNVILSRCSNEIFQNMKNMSRWQNVAYQALAVNLRTPISPFHLSPILMPYSKNITIDFATPSSVSDT